MVGDLNPALFALSGGDSKTAPPGTCVRVCCCSSPPGVGEAVHCSKDNANFASLGYDRLGLVSRKIVLGLMTCVIIFNNPSVVVSASHVFNNPSRRLSGECRFGWIIGCHGLFELSVNVDVSIDDVDRLAYKRASFQRLSPSVRGNLHIPRCL